MNIELPPALFYGVGIILTLFGALRAYHLGWQRREIERARAEAKGDGDEDNGRRPATTARRHITFGLFWVVMGLFLLVSTYLKSRR
jgi:hypothetical protein